MKNRNLKRIALALVVTITSLCIAACSSGSDGNVSVASSDGSEDLHIAIISDIVSMDVHRTTNDYLVPMNVFDTLFKVVKNDNGSTSIENSLVEDYEVSVDGLKYDLTLRDGVVFSDGTPLQADDVKFTFERMLTLPDSQQTDYAISIEGAQDLLDGKADELKGITVEDTKHFSITLSEPFSGFLAQLATPATSIYSRSIVTSAGDDFGSVPEKTLGTGPYVIKSWDRGKELVFEYNPRYWGEEPSVKRAVVRIMDAPSIDTAFQKGDLDIVDCQMIDSDVEESVYKKSYADDIVSVDRLGMNYFMLNEANGPLSDVTVRKAVQLAIDRQSVLDSVYGGDGKLEDGIYPSGCMGYSDGYQGWLSYDPDKARQLLSDAGFASGFDMEISHDLAAPDDVKSTIDIIAKNLKDIGINVSVKSYDHESWLDLRNSGKMQSFCATWTLDHNDPDNIIYTFFGSKENTVIRSDNYPDDAVIKRIADARAIINQNDRMAEYAALEKKLVKDDAVWVPLFSLKHLFVTGDRVAGFTPQWAGWSDIYFTGVKLK